MAPSKTKRSLHAVAALFAAALMSTSALVATGGSAKAQTPDWALQCAATTPNPWIRSGYCEKHQAWDKYYCQCAFVPNHPLPSFGRRHRGNLDNLDNTLDETSDSDVLK